MPKDPEIRRNGQRIVHRSLRAVGLERKSSTLEQEERLGRGSFIKNPHIDILSDVTEH